MIFRPEFQEINHTPGQEAQKLARKQPKNQLKEGLWGEWISPEK